MNVNSLPTLENLDDNGYIIYSNGGNELYKVRKGTFLKGMTGGTTYYGTSSPSDDLGKDGDFYGQVALESIFPNIVVSRHGSESYTLPAEESTDSTEHTGTLFGWLDEKEGGTEYQNNNGFIDSFYPIVLPPSPVLDTYIEDKKYIAGGQQSYRIHNYIQDVEMSLSFDLILLGDVEFTQPSGGTDDFYGLYFPIDFPEPGEPEELGPVYAVDDDVPFGVLTDITENVRGIRFYKDHDRHHYEMTYNATGDNFFFAFNFGGVRGDFKNGNARVLVSNIKLKPIDGYNNITDIYIKKDGFWVKDNYARKGDLVITPLLQTGETIATITYDNVEYDIKAPSPEGAHMQVVPVVTSGIKIAEVYLSGESGVNQFNLYTPPGGGDCGHYSGIMTEDSSGNPLVTTSSYTTGSFVLENSDGGTYTTGPGLYLVDVVAHIVQNDGETINASGNEAFTIKLDPVGVSGPSDVKFYVGNLYRQRANIFNGETFDCCYAGSIPAYIPNADGVPRFSIQFNSLNFSTAYNIKECSYAVTMYKIGEY